MKMNRRDFFPTAYLAAVAGTKLATGKTSPAEIPGRFHFDAKTRRYSLPGPVGLKNVRLGVDIDSAAHWADESAHLDWKGDETGEARIALYSPPVPWRVRAINSVRSCGARKQVRLQKLGSSARTRIW